MRKGICVGGPYDQKVVTMSNYRYEFIVTDALPGAETLFRYMWHSSKEWRYIDCRERFDGTGDYLALHRKEPT